MKKLIQIIAISCLPFLSGAAVAVDGTDPKDPYLRYNFDTTKGVERMGFGFAQPIITIIPGYGNKTDGKVTSYRPVVIIAGGYDPTKDYLGAYGVNAAADPEVEGREPAADGSRHTDKVGNAIYFLDALSGELVARIVGETDLPSGDVEGGVSEVASKTSGVGQIVEADLKHSIPASITPVDSQGDGLTDRIYFIDIIGNIWRLDIIPSSNSSITADWKLNNFAKLGTDGAVGGLNIGVDYSGNDRRFFNQIDVIRTKSIDGKNVDALMVGSGNIADPKGVTAVGKNAFFMIYDENTMPIMDDRTITPIDLDDLYDASADGDTGLTMGNDTTSAINSGKKGWYLSLYPNEKVVSAATTINGTTFFTTIVAGPDDVGCSAPGELPASYLYAVNMHTAAATKAAPWITSDDGISKDSRRDKLDGGMAFQQIDPYVSTGGDISVILPGGDTAEVGDADGTAKTLEGASTYWRTDNQ